MGEKADCIKITSAFDQAQALKIWLGSVVGVFPCLAHALASTPAPEAASIAAPSPVVLADSVFDVIDKNPVPSQMAIGTLAVPTSVLLGLTLNQTPYPNIAALQHQGDFFYPSAHCLTHWASPHCSSMTSGTLPHRLVIPN